MRPTATVIFTLARQLWLAFTAAFLLFTPFFNQLNVTLNRYCFNWTSRDLVVSIACVSIVGSGFFVAFHCSRRIAAPWVQRFATSAFVGITGLAITINVIIYIRKGLLALQMHSLFQNQAVLLQFLHLAWILPALCCLFTNARRITNTCKAVCLILSPIIPIYIGHACTYVPWPSTSGAMPAPVRNHNPIPAMDRGRPDIFLFVLDEWSYERTFVEGVARPCFPNMRAFSDQSLVFHKAYSPGGGTMEAMTGLLFQRHDKFTIGEDTIYFAGMPDIPAQNHPTLFQPLRTRGYHTAMIGYYHPYAALLTSNVDYCYSQSFYKHFGSSFPGLMANSFFQAGLAANPPRKDRLKAILQNLGAPKLFGAIDSPVTTLIAAGKSPLFTVTHYNVPHPPFVFSATGTKSPWKFYPCTSERYYEDNLLYMDYVIGTIMQRLKAAKRYDASLIILTSDHAWRQDPHIGAENRAQRLCHIPLCIKLPGQRTSLAMGSRCSTADLGEVLTAYLEGSLTLDNAAAFMDQERFTTFPLPELISGDALLKFQVGYF